MISVAVQSARIFPGENEEIMMQRHGLTMLVLTVFCALGTLFADAAPPDGAATITVDVDRPGIKVCPTLYGIFFEEINHAGEG